MAQLAFSFETEQRKYTLIPSSMLEPHPLNPRPFSEKYQARVFEDKVEELIGLIQKHGFTEPITVRLLASEAIQIIAGHHRWVAAKEIGLAEIPCNVVDVDDKTAAMMLLEFQGKEVDTWSSARHAYECCQAYGGNGLMTVSEYASKRSRKPSTISDLINAAKLGEKCFGAPKHLSVYAASQISSLPNELQDWFIDLHIQNDWGEKERTAALKAAKAIDIPEHLEHWLNPDEYRKKAVQEAVTGGDRISRDISNWIACAEKHLEELPSDRPIWRFDENDQPFRESLDMRSEFLKALPSMKFPSGSRIDKLADSLFSQVKGLDAAYESWLEQQKSVEEQRKADELRKAEDLQRRLKFAPTGLHGDVRELLPSLEPEQFDLILTDPPYLLSNGGITCRGNKQTTVDKNFADDAETAIAPKEWMALCLPLLKPGGYLVFSCTDHLDISKSLFTDLGYEFCEKLYWIKRSAPPRLTPTGHRACIEEIWVIKKPGTSNFAYDDLKDRYWEGKQPSNYLEFEQCSGNERLGWHDTQKPLKLWTYLLEAYCPKEGTVLDPFAGTATTAIAAKQTNRIATWCEKDEGFFSKALSRIESTKYSWE